MFISDENEICSANEINMQTELAFSNLLAEKFSCSVMFSKKEFAIVSNVKFVRGHISCSAELSMKNVL